MRLLHISLGGCLVSVAAALSCLEIMAGEPEMTKNDGFLAECIGNGAGGTGLCRNIENNQNYKCLIIPGQVIDCTSKANQSFQCVFVSSAIIGQSQFWCDPNVESMLSGELSIKKITNNKKDVEINTISNEASNQDKDTTGNKENSETDLEVMTRIMMGEQ